MTATQTTAPANILTDWTLLQYHNKCVARAANWADGCKSVIHLQVDSTSSLLATVLKVACFAIVSVGLLIYDVLNEAWRGAFSKNEVAPQPAKATEPEAAKEPAKAKTATPTPKKNTPRKPVEGTLTKDLQMIDEAIAQSLEIADEHTATLEEIAGSVKTIKTKVSHLETNLSKIQDKIDGLAKQITTEITPLIAKASAKTVNFGSATILPSNMPASGNGRKYPRTPDPSMLSADDLLRLQDSSDEEALSLSSDDEDEFETPPIPEGPKQTISLSARDMQKVVKALAKHNIVLVDVPPTRSANSTEGKRKGSLFDANISLTPIRKTPKQKPTLSNPHSTPKLKSFSGSGFTSPDTNPLDMSLTPCQPSNTRSTLRTSSPGNRLTPQGRTPSSIRPSVIGTPAVSPILEAEAAESSDDEA